MIYGGKEYVEVTDGSAKIGDLIHVTNTSGAECDVWCFSNDDNFETPCVANALPGSYYCLDNEFDDYRRYRCVKDVEEITTNVFKEGDRVQVVGCRGVRQERFTGYFGKVMYINDLGKYSVLLDVGPQLAFPQESLKLVEETPVKFKSGDRVRLTEFELNGQINFGNFNGYVDGEKFDGDYKVKFDDGAFGFFPSTSLELIKSYTIGQLKSYEEFKKMIDELKAIVPLSNDVGVSPANAVPKKEHELINQTSKNIKQTDTVNSPSLSENINDIFTEIKDIIVAKNENYGDSFSKQYQKYGMVSVEMRLNDKFMRLEQLVAGEKDKVGESIEDTLKDIIGYATLALIELEGEK